ncbi:MAG: carboxymuconolactone decarboxylase family protein [Balneolaceae bacterium]
MQRIEALNPETTTGKSKELFEGIQSKLGMVPNMMRTMGNSPAVLSGYLTFNDALAQSSLGGKLGELIALTVANANSCEYCNAAHSFIGEKLVGIAPTVIEAAKERRSSDIKTQAALTFAKTLVRKKGNVNDRDIDLLKENGFTDGEVTEIIAHTSLNIFTNYFNNALSVVVDFPEVELVNQKSI